MSSTLVVGLKESMTLPIKNTNDGMPQPVTIAENHPMYIKSISDLSAKQYSFEYGTIGPSYLFPDISLEIRVSTFRIRMSESSSPCSGSPTLVLLVCFCKSTLDINYLNIGLYL